MSSSDDQGLGVVDSSISGSSVPTEVSQRDVDPWPNLALGGFQHQGQMPGNTTPVSAVDVETAVSYAASTPDGNDPDREPPVHPLMFVDPFPVGPVPGPFAGNDEWAAWLGRDPQGAPTVLAPPAAAEEPDAAAGSAFRAQISWTVG